MTTTPSYVTHYLPAITLTALGVSLCLPQLSSAAVQGLPPDRFGSGSAVNQAVRNLGATLGVALVIALTSDLTPAIALDGFRRVWWLLVASGVTVSLLSTRLRTPGLLAQPATVDAGATVDVGAVGGTVDVVVVGAGWRSKSLQS
jgi:hypothetical protein